MEAIQSVLDIVVTIPAWLLAASFVVGATCSFIGLLLALLILDAIKRKAVAAAVALESIRRAKATQGVTHRSEAGVAENVEDVEDSDTVAADVPAIVKKLSPVTVTVPQDGQGDVAHKKPVPPIRQHYWYYVSGVSGRFATLREALTASGVADVPADRPLDWKKLSQVTRARIQRVGVDEEQPAAPPVVAMHRERVQRAQDEPIRRRSLAVEEDAESVVRKPLGKGAFVTFTKKKGK